MSVDDLRTVFETFASFGSRLGPNTTLDNSHFAKLVRDSKLVDDSILSPSQVDLIFAKVKAKGARKISFKEFQTAVELIAHAKYGNDVRGPENIRRSIVSAGGPQLDGVHLPVTDGLIDRLTDTRLYSGIHKERFDDAGRGRGKEGRDAPALGTGTVDQYGGGTVSDLSQIIRPTFRGGTHMNNHARAAALSPGGHPSSAGAAAASSSSSSPFSPSGGGSAYTGPGGAHLLLASPQRGSGGAGGPGSPRSSSTLEGFPAGTPLRAAAAASAASSASAYAASPLSSSMTPSRQQLNPSPGAGSDTSTTVRPATAPSIRSPQRNERPMLRGGDPAAVASPAPRVVIESAELQAIFMAYCAFGTTARMLEELDSARFAKLCRESGVSDGRLVTPASVDVVFARLKKKGKRTITYPEFQQALASLAPLRYPDVDIVTGLQSVVERIIESGGPVVTTGSGAHAATGTIFDKLTDSRNYTGAHKQRFDEFGRGMGKEGREDC